MEFLKTTQNTFFNGESNINVASGAEFIYHSEDTKENFLGNDFSNIVLTGDSILSVIGNGIGSSKFTLDDNWFESTGETANNLNFSDAAYTINNIFDRGNGDTILDNVNFTNAEVTMGSDFSGENSSEFSGAKNYDFGANKYTLENSELNFSNRVAGDTFNFDELNFNDSGNLSGISIDINLVVGEHEPYADKFVYQNGSGIVNITKLYITDDDGLLNSEGNKGVFQIFDGLNATEDNHIQIRVSENQDLGFGWATNKYVYNVDTTTTKFTNDSIVVAVKNESNADTLRDMNIYGSETDAKSGNRGFSFSASENNNTYNISRDLGETAAGTFTVVGDIGENGEKIILSGKLNNIVTKVGEDGDSKLSVENGIVTYDGVEIPDGYYEIDESGIYTIHLGELLEKDNIQQGDTPHGSMFEIVNDTKFEMNNVSIEDATRYQTDDITEGAAIYANNSGSDIILNNVDFKNNSVSKNSDGEGGNGGAIANIESGSFGLYNSIISGNTAEGNGGAIYNNDNMSILNAEFTGNKAGESGGAIYTNHNMLISDSNFSGNEDKTGSNDIYIEGKDTNVNFVSNSGTNYIESGIAGDGNFIKSGAGDLNITGVNKNLTGDFEITYGDVNYSADSEDDSFVGGKVSIAAGSNLNLTINQGIDNQHIQNVSGYINENGKNSSGNLNIDGGGTLYLDGANNSFGGKTSINNGVLIYTADDNNERYLGGSTFIGENSELHLIINENIGGQSISSVSGSGLFDKTGGGNINLSGNNTFSGTTTIQEGSVTYIANQTYSNYFSGDTYISEDGKLIANISNRNSDGDLIVGQTISNIKNAEGSANGGNFEKTGNGTLQLTGDNSSFTGTTTVSGGHLTFVNQEKTASGTTVEHKYTGGNTVVESGAEFEYTVAGGNDVTNNIKGLGGDGLFTKAGDGELILDGDNSSFTGNVAIEQGELSYDSVSGNGSSFLNANLIELSENTALNINNKENENSYVQNLIGSGAFNKDGAGTVNLSGKNDTYTGLLTINNGTLAFSNANEGTYISGNTLINSDGILDYTATEDGNLSNFSGTGSINKKGEATVTLTGDNSDFEGALSIKEGIISYTNDEDNKYITGSTSISEGAALDVTTNAQTTDSIGQISGNGDFYKNGEGNLNLTGDNSGFEGALSIKEGIISYTNDEGNKYITGSTSISDEAALDVTTNAGTTDSIGQISGNGDWRLLMLPQMPEQMTV